MPKHLTLDERNIIAQRLNEGFSFKAIANELGKNRTTVQTVSCSKRNTSCTLEKRFYQPVAAQNEYCSVLSEARSGLSLSEAEIAHLDSIVSPLLRKKQSLHNICANHSDSIMVSESTLYRLVDYNLF